MTTTQIHKDRRSEAWELSGEKRAVLRRVDELADRLSTYGRVSTEVREWTGERLVMVVGCLYGDGE